MTGAGENHKQKILFLNGPANQDAFSRSGRAYIPALLFSALLKQDGHQVCYRDADLQRSSPRELLKVITSFAPDVIGFSCYCENRFETIQVIKYLRQNLTKTIFVAGGHQFSHDSEDALENIPELDIICRDEADDTIRRLAGIRFDRSHLRTLPGLTYRDIDNQIVSTNAAPPPVITHRPIPDWEQVKGLSLAEYGVITSRGCIARCNFCATGSRQLRFTEPAIILKEIDVLLNLYGHKRLDYKLNFYDDSFTLHKEHFHEILIKMIENKYELHWTTRTRADKLTSETIELLRRAGCYNIGTSFDAPNQKILDSCGKNEKYGDIFDGIVRTAAAGIQVGAAILLGNINETLEDSREGIQLYKTLKKIPGVNPFIGQLLIYPGTKLEKISREMGTLPRDFSWYKLDDLKRVPAKDRTGRLPFFQNNLVDYKEIQYLIARATITSDSVQLKRFLKRSNWKLIFSASVYMKGLYLLWFMMVTIHRKYIKR